MTPYRERRTRLADMIRKRGGGVAIIATAPEVIRNRDAHYPYRWDSYFYYLTGFTEPEAVLVMNVDASGEHSTLFCREKNEEREIWDGYRFGPELAREQFGFDRGMPIAQLDAELVPLLADRAAIFTPIGAAAEHDAAVARWLNAVRAQARTGVSAPGQVIDVRGLLDDMRLIKDEHEVALMRRAAQISAAAHVRAMRASRPGRFEFEIEAELEHEFRMGGSRAPAYGSIVASGRHACVLHYRANDARLSAGDLLLIDAGCELDGYASDITRTFPVSGRFSAAQRTIYDIVLAAQDAAIEATRPGQRFIDPHNAAVRVLVRGLIDCALLSGSVDAAIESGSYKRFYMHRTGHWLGMDVHDCGDYREPGEPISAGKSHGASCALAWCLPRNPDCIFARPMTSRHIFITSVSASRTMRWSPKRAARS